MGTGTGWLSQHVLVRDAESGLLVGATPCYVKSHSAGEYVFDHSWASAYARAGGRYYPKLQCCVPFTPVTGASNDSRVHVTGADDPLHAGPRLLVHDQAPPGTSGVLAGGLKALAEAVDASSVHVTFPSRREADLLASDSEWLVRSGLQYHWPNQDYRSFADFEAALVQKKRKAVRQERKRAAEGLRISRLRGGDLKPRHWDAFYQFYTDTAERKWGSAYLTREFFDLLGEGLADSCMLVMAETEEPGGGGTIVAGALNLVGGDAIFGRNWGCRGEWPCLHFEVCYYQAIEEAIACRLQRVEAGAQGEHKLQRGYLPTLTYSTHYVRDPQFRRAVGDFLQREQAEMERAALMLSEEANPYKDLAAGIRSVD